MQLKTINSLSNKSYSVRLETTMSDAEVELISDFGEPTISVGGNFYGDSITYAGTLGTVTQGAAVGYLVNDGLIVRYNATSFSAGTCSLGTISVTSDISYTLTSSSKEISTDFPYAQNFLSENTARIYSKTMEWRFVDILEELRSNEDAFSGEVVETL